MSNLNSLISDLDVLDSFFTNDLNLVYSFNPKGIFDTVVLTGLVNNIFDVKYVDRGYYFTYDDDWSDANTITTIEGAGYYPQAGINFLIGLTLKF